MHLNIFVENYVAGGLEKFYFDLIDGLIGTGFKITLLTNHLEGLEDRIRDFIDSSVQWIPYKNVTSTTLDYQIWKVHRVNYRRGASLVGSVIARLPLHFASHVRLRSLFRGHPADIVHIINGGYPGAQGCITAASAARSAGIRYRIMSVQSCPFPRKNAFDKIMDRQLARDLNILVPNSRAAGQGLRLLRGFPESKIFPIQSGTPAPRFDPDAGVQMRAEIGLPAKSVMIGVVAALEPMKGHLVILKALREIKAEFPQLHLIFVGEGVMRRQIEEFISHNDLEGRVTLLGHRNDARRLTNAFDIVALPSFLEGLPIAILEAMALGKPIVATNVGGIPEEIDHEISGLLVPPCDSLALADSLRQLLRSPVYAEQLGLAAREKYHRQFTSKQMVGSFIKLYNQAG